MKSLLPSKALVREALCLRVHGWCNGLICLMGSLCAWLMSWAQASWAAMLIVCMANVLGSGLMGCHAHCVHG
eukprot:scaffold248357_cov22-Tisochrysis_lutea.AAC.1